MWTVEESDAGALARAAPLLACAGVLAAFAALAARDYALLGLAARGYWLLFSVATVHNVLLVRAWIDGGQEGCGGRRKGVGREVVETVFLDGPSCFLFGFSLFEEAVFGVFRLGLQVRSRLYRRRSP